MNTARSLYDPGGLGAPCWCRTANRSLSLLLGGALLLTVVAVAGAGPSAWVNDLTPITAADWDYDKAAHLIERAGFGATPAEVERLAAMTPEAAVDQLVKYTTIDNSTTPAVRSVADLGSRVWTRSRRAGRMRCASRVRPGRRWVSPCCRTASQRRLTAGGQQVFLRAALECHRDPATRGLVGRADARDPASARGEAARCSGTGISRPGTPRFAIRG